MSQTTKDRPVVSPAPPAVPPVGERSRGTVLVAGATGRLGRHVAREFAAQGYKVRALVRDAVRLQAVGVHPREVVEADLLDAPSLAVACDGVDVVFSCAGASMQLAGWGDRRSFMEVDYGGNANLLQVARTAGVAKFVYVSLFGARELLRTEYAAAHERFVGSLAASGVPYTIVRPTGFFSFFAELFEMARRGRAVMIGDGRMHTNPIDERDVAELCVAAAQSEEREIAAGGPEVLSRRRITELAFEALGRKPRITSIPPGMFDALTTMMGPFNRRMQALAAFGAAVSSIECVAPRLGRRTLADYYRSLASPEPDVELTPGAEEALAG